MVKAVRQRALAVCIFTIVWVSGCENEGSRRNATTKPTPLLAVAHKGDVKNGDYPGRGKITRINAELGSVEMNHEEIPGVMPAMLMEFYVSDKKMLDGLRVGDAIDFTLHYKDRSETITAISKAK